MRKILHLRFSRPEDSKVTGGHVQAHLAHLLDAFHGQQTHLAVPVSGMGVAHDTVVLLQFRLIDGGFAFSLVFTDADGNYLNRHNISFRYPPT